MDFLRSRADLTTLVAHLEAAGAAPLLEDPTATLTLFAPTNHAWSGVDASRIDTSDLETLQQIITFLIAQGQVVVPTVGVMLPEDLDNGGVSLTVDSLNGAMLQVFAGPGGIVLRDGSPLTPDSLVVSGNNMVCNSPGSSVVNIIEQAVPMPFS